MKVYDVWNGFHLKIKAESPEEAEKIFLDSFNECICEQVSVKEIRRKTTHRRIRR